MPPRKTYNTYRKNTFSKSWMTTQQYRWNPTTYPCNSPAFKTAQRECQWRMGSYWNVYTQFTGAGARTNLSPTNANKWTKYVTNGFQVYRFTNKDFCRYFGAKWAYTSPKSAYQYLRNHYGTAIKDVTRGKGNCWLIATTRTPTGRPFINYDWK